MFKLDIFNGASGVELDFKIDCDSLTVEDWVCLAQLTQEMVMAFNKVVGVPSGGLPYAEALKKFEKPDYRPYTLLVVDDVWTTGYSMNKFLESYKEPYDEVCKFVVFNRDFWKPSDVMCLFTLEDLLTHNYPK